MSWLNYGTILKMVPKQKKLKLQEFFSKWFSQPKIQFSDFSVFTSYNETEYNKAIGTYLSSHSWNIFRFPYTILSYKYVILTGHFHNFFLFETRAWCIFNSKFSSCVIVRNFSWKNMSICYESIRTTDFLLHSI